MNRVLPALGWLGWRLVVASAQKTPVVGTRL